MWLGGDDIGPRWLLMCRNIVNVVAGLAVLQELPMLGSLTILQFDGDDVEVTTMAIQSMLLRQQQRPLIGLLVERHLTGADEQQPRHETNNLLETPH